MYRGNCGREGVVGSDLGVYKLVYGNKGVAIYGTPEIVFIDVYVQQKRQFRVGVITKYAG